MIDVEMDNEENRDTSALHVCVHTPTPIMILSTSSPIFDSFNEKQLGCHNQLTKKCQQGQFYGFSLLSLQESMHSVPTDRYMLAARLIGKCISQFFSVMDDLNFHCI